MSARRRLNFATPDAVSAEVQRLRRGYTQCGNWNLPQMSWHLGTAIKSSMRPPPYEPKKIGLWPKIQLRALMTFKRIPAGRVAPARIMPTDNVSEDSVDLYLAALNDLKNFKGDFAPHPLFGVITHDQFMSFHLIHSAHHLGYLTPTTN